MAEVAGLVLGAVGVAGVIGAFKDAIDLFSLVVDSRHLGRDYEILETKLDIEKTLLLQWADRVKLLRLDYDRRLDDAHTQSLVVRICECIATLLSDAPELQRRYGLRSPSETTVNINRVTAATASTPRTSELRWQQFQIEYDALRSEGRVKKPSFPALSRARWVIRDKQKFELLVQDLAHFVSKLGEVLPEGRENAAVRLMADQDLQYIQDLRQLKIILEAAAGSHKIMSDSTEKAIIEVCKDRILSKLWFRKIEDRRESIATAHRKTLQWALNEATTDVPWDNLSTWLQSGEGVYWVSGKAGSGKSTLMKYLYSDSHIQDYLSRWAGGEPFSLYNFFFMNLGSEEQKSQEGLSRTLLHQILSTNRDLIPEALPYMWKEIHDSVEKNTKEDISLPSMAETQRAFSVVIENTQRLGKLCFLIDGLDEVVGDYMDGIDFIRRLAANDRIKVVVSSRPLPEFVAAFDGYPKLLLQDLNREDITQYVEDVVAGHKYMKRLIRQNTREGQELINDILNKSSGVFLWVILACRALLSGFADHDRLSELRRRVDDLPPELEDMFQLMLNKINKRHRQQGAQLLRICYIHQRAPWPGACKELCTLGLALALDYNDESLEFRPLQVDVKADTCLEFEGRLRSRCGGLLEVQHRTMPCLCGSTDIHHHNQDVDSQVRFMHRTVFEFLSNEDIWSLDCLKMEDDPSFDIATALSVYGIHMALECPTLKLGYEDPGNAFLGEAARWAVVADTEPRGQPGIFFDNIQAVIQQGNLSRGRSSEALSPSHLSRFLYRLRFESWEHVGLLMAVEAGAVNYVRSHPDLPALLEPQYWSDTLPKLPDSQPILCHAANRALLASEFCVTEHGRDYGGEFPSVGMVGLLVKARCDPHQPISYGAENNPWRLWYQNIPLYPEFSSAHARMQLLRVAEQLLEADVELEAIHIEESIRKIALKGSSDDGLRAKAQVILDKLSEKRQLVSNLSTRSDSDPPGHTYAASSRRLRQGSAALGEPTI